VREAVGVGKTVEEAIAAALKELKIEREQADITIQELPSKGLLGIFPGKDAVVLVREHFDPVLFLSDWLEGLLEKMRIHARVRVQPANGGLEVNITGSNLGTLIGRKGQTLDSLQYLATLAVNKRAADFVPVVVDVGDYRKKRRLSIEKTAMSAMKRVLRTGQKVVLAPMTPAERRLVHLALGDKEGIVTYSIGEEPRRKVVVDLKRD